VACLKILSQYLPGHTEENDEKLRLPGNTVEFWTSYLPDASLTLLPLR